MSKIGLFLLPMLSCALSIQAAIFHEIDTTKSLCCEFSRDHQNRIVVDSGKVKKIICPEGSFQVQMEEESGQAFVYAWRDFESSFTFSVITDGGFVQDIEVGLADKPAEVVVLREPFLSKKGESLASLHLYDGVVTSLKEVLSGNIPEGYRKRSLKDASGKLFGEVEIRSKLLQVLEGPHETLYCMELQNMNEEESVLEEAHFFKKGIRWVYLDKRTIPFKEKSFVIVSEAKS